jgi:hypothetical protein
MALRVSRNKNTGKLETECWLQADEQASSPKAKDLLNLAEETTASSSSKKKKREVAEEVPGINTYLIQLLEVC